MKYVPKKGMVLISEEDNSLVLKLEESEAAGHLWLCRMYSSLIPESRSMYFICQVRITKDELDRRFREALEPWWYQLEMADVAYESQFQDQII